MGGQAGVPLSMGNRSVGVAFCRATKPTPPTGWEAQHEDPMTEPDFEAKLAELDRLLNDPEVRMDPDRVWTILAEISGKETRVPVRA
ncbi:MAG: hypothetical protein AVDCRST_MAG04-1360 [uncultured Acetobacteraceae bacterium]|jgi:hypothetical protein|uniref:Uncharacterized protein n=1 Tax=uncultured Acetobacteraceae bacterium TaxID=169975 RepID=A0A6J4HXL4_9PROT|nr:MAG: hypothetical protein AVDCRST_MAG04-1360 [uncultured Acetobacteraceae bacterium]